MVVDLLYTLTTQCVDLLGASEAGLLLADESGGMQVAAASNERARVLELFQIQNDEGPCLECFRTGRAVNVERLDDGGRVRWPRFAPASVAEGYVSVLALPMRLRGEVIGALNLFVDTSSPPIGEDVIPIAQAMADVATIAILQDRLVRSRGELAAQLQFALDSRVVIEQAKGMLAMRLGVDTGEAFDLLRQHSRDQRIRLADVAATVVDGELPGGWEAPARGRSSQGRRDQQGRTHD